MVGFSRSVTINFRRSSLWLLIQLNQNIGKQSVKNNTIFNSEPSNRATKLEVRCIHNLVLIFHLTSKEAWTISFWSITCPQTFEHIKFNKVHCFLYKFIQLYLDTARSVEETKIEAQTKILKPKSVLKPKH